MSVLSDPKQIIWIFIILLISIDIHELAHAVVADRLGDPTPRRLGEISLNPFVHMDQFGLIMLVILSITGFGFTFGRTHVTPSNLKFGAQRGGAIVAIAGPLSNLAVAAAAAVYVVHYPATPDDSNYQYYLFASQVVFTNLLLFVLNLLPIPPLDGFSVLGGFLGARQMYSLAPLIQYGPIVLLGLFVLEPQVHVLGNLVGQPINSIQNWMCPNCAYRFG